MIAFLTQYYKGLGHSQRTKYIAEQTAKFCDVLIIDQLFKPPLEYKVPHVSFLQDYKIPAGKKLYDFIQHEDLVNHRIKCFINILEKKDIKLLVCEGFPFCRQQFAHEYFRYFEECKKRNIKIIISVRDFPWDEPHENQLQDWVSYTQNIVCKYYADKILVHGDKDILPLVSDRIKLANGSQIVRDIESLITYTGYVCDEEQPKHNKKNNRIFVSTGLNKEEGLLLFKKVIQIAPMFSDYEFIMPAANRYKNIPAGKKGNVSIVDYIPNLRNYLTSCAAYITYGGYNATTEILKGSIPSIIIPRTDGKKMEQFVRCYRFKPYDYFKVMNDKEFYLLPELLKQVLSSKPKEFEFSLKGASNSANELFKIYTR